MKTKLILLFLLTILQNINAQSQSTDCLKDFDYLVKKIQTDYPGYNNKVTDKNRGALMALENTIRQKIKSHPDSCGLYLNQYAAFFKDHHLRVNRANTRQTKQDSDEPMDVSTYGKNVQVNTDSLLKANVNSKGIEGVWKGFRDEFLITRDGNTLIGVAVKYGNWKAGQVMFSFKPTNDTVFVVTNYSRMRSRTPYTSKASIHLDGRIIEFHDDTRCVRKSDSDLLDRSTLYTYQAQFPNGGNTYPLAMYLNDSTYYLRIPGFYDNTANDFVEKHWNDIVSRPNLIIDIRNNGGGQDGYYRELSKLMYTSPYETKGVEWLASKGNIELFENAIVKGEIRDGEDGQKWTMALIDAMKKNKGGFVDHPYNKDGGVVSLDTVYPLPRRVGIIINENNASSAEQFLLAAKESSKVTLFGNQHTAGVLDYSNITPNSFPSTSFVLWCPMTRSKRLPEHPIDNIGIAPDVMIPFPACLQLYDRMDDWVYFVKNYLEIEGEKSSL